jgi:adenosine 3'-phospho 5'-phosphosulfate transporter B3
MHPRLLRLAAGVLIFHVLNSVLQEGVLYLPGFKHGVLLSFLQTIAVTFFAFIQFRNAGEVRKTPLHVYVGLSIVASLSVVLTNKGSILLNYPTQVVFKSSKLLFVMVMRAIFLRNKRRPGLLEAIGAVIVVAGLTGFTWASHKHKIVANPEGMDSDFVLGVVVIMIALVCDSLLYMGEEAYCFSTYQSSNVEVILFTTVFGILNTFGTMVITGNVGESIRYSLYEPRLIVFVIAFSACNFLGTHFLLSIVSEFDANYAVLTTSVRKTFTILLSFLIYPKPFTWLHSMSLATVVGGIYIHDRAKKAHHHTDKLHHAPPGNDAESKI